MILYISDGQKLPIFLPVNGPYVYIELFRLSQQFFGFHIPKFQRSITAACHIMVFLRGSSQPPYFSVIMTLQKHNRSLSLFHLKDFRTFSSDKVHLVLAVQRNYPKVLFHNLLKIHNLITFLQPILIGPHNNLSIRTTGYQLRIFKGYHRPHLTFMRLDATLHNIILPQIQISVYSSGYTNISLKCINRSGLGFELFFA